MGVGKSSIGRDLSYKLKMEFKDIDSIIEKKLSLSISEIFKKKGEKFFRDIEEKETINYLNKNKVVLALGGGAFLNEKGAKIVFPLLVLDRYSSRSPRLSLLLSLTPVKISKLAVKKFCRSMVVITLFSLMDLVSVYKLLNHIMSHCPFDKSFEGVYF